MADTAVHRASAWLIASTVAGGALSYAYTLALARVLPVDEYPAFAAGQSLLLVAGTVAGASAPWALSQHLARHRSGKSGAVEPDEAISFAILANVGQGVVMAAVLVVVAAGFADGATRAVIASSALAIFVGATTVGLLQGRLRFGAIAWVRLVDVVVRCALGLALVAAGAGAAGALAGFGIGSLVVAAVGLVALGAGFRFRSRAALSWPLWRHAAGLGAVQGLVAVLAATDAVIVVLVEADPARAGSYQLATVIGRIPIYVSMALAMAVFPTMGSADHRLTASTARSSFRSYVALTVPAALVLATVPDGLLGPFFPASYGEVGSLLVWASITGVAVGAVNLLTTYFQAAGVFRATVVALGAIVAVAIVAMLVGHASGGVTGLAIGAASASSLAAGWFLSASHRQWGILDGVVAARAVAVVAGAGVALHLASSSIPMWSALTVVIGVLTVRGWRRGVVPAPAVPSSPAEVEAMST